MKRKIKIILMSAVVLFIASSPANAEIFTVELPEFLGPWEDETYMKTASFDFGTSFVEIYDVRLQLGGTSTLGSAHGDGLIVPEDEWIDFPRGFEAYMDVGGDVWGMGFSVHEGPFLAEESFEPSFGSTWDFLLDGSDEATLRLGGGFGFGWIVVTEPTADISEAYLIVDGIVPEPATILLFGLGGLILRS